MLSFFNTTGESGDTLASNESQARKQDDAVMDFFKLNPDKWFTPFEVWDKMIEWGMIDARVPITSIRRSINSMTKSGRLIKNIATKLERLGRSNHVWKLKERYEQGRLF